MTRKLSNPLGLFIALTLGVSSVLAQAQTLHQINTQLEKDLQQVKFPTSCVHVIPGKIAQIEHFGLVNPQGTPLADYSTPGGSMKTIDGVTALTYLADGTAGPSLLNIVAAKDGRARVAVGQMLEDFLKAKDAVAALPENEATRTYITFGLDPVINVLKSLKDNPVGIDQSWCSDARKMAYYLSFP